jgi:HK97 family phage major capsid protein
MPIVHMSDPPTRAGWYLRAVACKAMHPDSPSGAAAMANARWGFANPAAEMIERAAVAPGTTTDTTWAAPLATGPALEILAAVREKSALSAIGARKVPFIANVVSQTNDATAYWVGQNKVKPLSPGLSFLTNAGLAPLKLSSILVVTKDLMKLADPATETLFRNSLVDALVLARDAAAFDKANAGIAGVKPPSLTSGVTPIAATTDPNVDLRKLLGGFAGNLETAWFVMNAQAASSLAGLERPGMSTRSGGELLGIPVAISRAIPAGDIILVDSASVALAEGDIETDVSQQSTIEMNTAPTDPPVAATVQVSLWANNLVALRSEQFINWDSLEAGVSLITGAAYA